MLSCLTANDIANTVRLTRTTFAGAIVITEGGTDIRVYERFLNKPRCRFIPSNGKPNAVKATLILDGENFAGLLTIVDADFDYLESITPPSPNILFTDTHDLDTMLLGSSSLDKVLSELLSIPKAKSMPAPILTLAFQAALPVGYFRWISSPHKDNLGLKFKGIVFANFVTTPSFTTNVDDMINEVTRVTGSCSIDVTNIKAQLATLNSGSFDKWQVCSGHDLVELLYLALKIHWGNHRLLSITSDIFAAMLRMAYEYSDFKSSNLFRQILAWQTNNASFQVIQ
ncbi:MAG: hypothetical protein C0417_08840 [Chlorobiaceae bacterium]|nr:hypothetical protein [Chlorobiaceae bacterium]